LGGSALVLLTVLGIRFHSGVATAALLYLLAIVVTSLWGHIVPTILVSIVAILGLDYFFSPPLYAFLPIRDEDLAALFTFLITAFVVTQLVSRARRAAARWQAVFEHNPTMYFLVDAAGIVRSVNPLGAEQLGYTTTELVGRPVLELFVQADRTAVQRDFAVCLGHLGRTMQWEYRKARKDGTVVWVRETVKAAVINQRPWVLVACEDISARKRTEEELHRTQAELAHAARVLTMGELTTSIAHEVNQPLSGIVTNASACLRWLAGEAPNLEEARAAAQRIIRDGNRASEVVGRIRALAKKSATEQQRLDLNDAIQEVVALAQGEVRRNQVVVRTELAGDLPSVVGDRVQLQQVVLNLVMNGIEAMSTVEDRPRALVIRTERGAGDEAQVTVQDSGIGLDPQGAETIFEAFYSTKHTGMGMGLSISRSIVENHGGRLWAVPGAGPGATFQFTVPERS
jgi:PAS domain S-box-containing protein